MTAKSADRPAASTSSCRNTGKVLFPATTSPRATSSSTTRHVAGRMLPYLRDRPIADGPVPRRHQRPADLPEERPADYFPDWVTRTEVKKQGGTLRHVVCDKPATLRLPGQPGLHRAARVPQPGRPAWTTRTSSWSTSTRRATAASTRPGGARCWLRDLLEGELGLTTLRQDHRRSRACTCTCRSTRRRLRHGPRVRPAGRRRAHRPASRS